MTRIDVMSIDDRSSHSSPTDEKDAGQGHPEIEISDRSSIRSTRRGAYDKEGAIYEEIGKAIGVSGARVRQIEREALRKLRLKAEDLMRVKQVRYKWEPGEDDG